MSEHTPSTPSDVSPPRARARKAYATPVVEMYGSLGDIVGTVGKTGQLDNTVKARPKASQLP